MTTRAGSPRSVGPVRPGRAPQQARAALLAPVLLVVLLAAGCSVRVVDAGAPVTDGQGAPTSPSAAAPAGGSDDGASVGAAPPDPAASDLLDRTALQAEVTRTGACGDDVDVDQAGAGVGYTGDCGTLTVSGASARVVAGHVDHLVVAGGGAQVVVASVDRVTIDAAGVRVAWESGDPRVTSSGADAAYGPVGTVRLATD